MNGLLNGIEWKKIPKGFNEYYLNTVTAGRDPFFTISAITKVSYQTAILVEISSPTLGSKN
ncbi:hypothetical protein SAMN05444162_4847 [Paenibacillaceae bacterium GAS479]|nr:hypothetical protein SAMN05444162_4847 [Paenibacillaceae bacterium GAS479]